MTVFITKGDKETSYNVGEPFEKTLLQSVTIRVITKKTNDSQMSHRQLQAS